MLKRAVTCLLVLLTTGLCAVLVRACWVDLIEIPGAGERPVFMAGDRVTVNRWTYGLRLAPMRLWGYARWNAAPVERGAWVAFNSPLPADDMPIDRREVFVGFCYAVPGDTLWMDAEGGVHRHQPLGKRTCMMEVPRKDAYVPVTSDNVRWYCGLINLHEEGLQAEVSGDSLWVSGHLVTSYRFKHDYYWMSSANPHNMADSRSFGLVPDRHVIGRLGRVLYSVDAEAPWYKPFRSKRTFMKVGREDIR